MLINNWKRLILNKCVRVNKRSTLNRVKYRLGADGVVPNRLRKCGRYIYHYVGGTIVGLSYMSFQNRHSVKTSHATREKIEHVFDLNLVASYIIAASVSWWIKQRVIATVTIKLKPALTRV